MTTPNSNSRLPEPLTPEERQLAARLAQLGPHGTPPPALDARIIAAARAVADGDARPRQGRWPALLGLAATLALAIGVTWQMQPGGEAASRDEAPRGRMSAVATDAVADSTEPAGKQEPRLADDAAQRDEQTKTVPMRIGPAAVEPDQTPAAVGPAKAAVSAISAPPPPLPKPPPPAAPPAPPRSPPATEQAVDAAPPAQAERETMTRRMPKSHAESSAASAPMDPAMPAASAPAVAGGDLAAVPVARDRELALADWLDRIRLRRDAGDLAGARESLRLLRHAYPRAVLPDDLGELADGDLDQR